MPEFVGDREPAPRRPLSGFVGVDPDLAEGGEEETRERLALPECGGSRGAPQVVDVAHKQAEVGVGDFLDRHRDRHPVPDIAGQMSQEFLGEPLDLLHR